MIGAILRAQWLTMRFGGRGRNLGLVVAILWYGLWTMMATATGILLTGYDRARLLFTLPLGLLGIFAYWQLMPILSASMGSALDLR